jgi:hypothetical protein
MVSQPCCGRRGEPVRSSVADIYGRLVSDHMAGLHTLPLLVFRHVYLKAAALESWFCTGTGVHCAPSVYSATRCAQNRHYLLQQGFSVERTFSTANNSTDLIRRGESPRKSSARLSKSLWGYGFSQVSYLQVIHTLTSRQTTSSCHRLLFEVECLPPMGQLRG